MINGSVALVINTVDGTQAIRDSYTLRRNALLQRVPYYTTIAGARAAAKGIAALQAGSLEVTPLQAYSRH